VVHASQCRQSAMDGETATTALMKPTAVSLW